MKNRIPQEDMLRVSAAVEAPAKKRRKLFAVLPTLLTLGNAACGFGAITFAATVGPTAAYGNELWIAGALIYVAMIFDMFDGTAARLMNQTSEFGANLDSLCDAVSFGVAPAFLTLQFMRSTHATEQQLDVVPWFEYPPRFLWVVGAMFVVCVLLRLARFNVETDEDDSHEFFSGLPSPAGAGVLASFPIVMAWLLRDLADDRVFIGHYLAQWLVPAVKVVVPVITIVVACLMVSRVRYPHFFNQLFSKRHTRKHLIQILAAVVVIILQPGLVLFVLFAYFAFGAPLMSGWRRAFRRIEADAGPGEETGEGESGSGGAGE
ncbi:MAG: CDP-alcohol phosphatidyltransferase family protein [Planctomycetaceae bacterium]